MVQGPEGLGTNEDVPRKAFETDKIVYGIEEGWSDDSALLLLRYNEAGFGLNTKPPNPLVKGT